MSLPARNQNNNSAADTANEVYAFMLKMKQDHRTTAARKGWFTIQDITFKYGRGHLSTIYNSCQYLVAQGKIEVKNARDLHFCGKANFYRAKDQSPVQKSKSIQVG